MTENLIALDGAILLVMLLGVQLLQPAVAVVAVAAAEVAEVAVEAHFV